MYVLVEFVKNYRETTGNWWSYYIWEPNNNPPAADYNADPKANSASFKYKNSIRWKTLNNNNESDRNDDIKNNSTNIRLGKEVLNTSWIRLEDVFSVTFLCLPRRLQDILKMPWRNNCKMSFWRCLKRRFEDILKKTSRKYVLKTSWRQTEDVLKKSWTLLAKRIWRRLED